MVSDPNFLVDSNFNLECGFEVTSEKLYRAISQTNYNLSELPFLLWQRVDLKSVGSIIGAYLSHNIAETCDAMVNPIEKGHPDIIPNEAGGSTEAELRNYPSGLEVKGTCGNLPTGHKIVPGKSRIDVLSAITWQAHHREVHQLLGTVWDFTCVYSSEPAPAIMGAFYSNNLVVDDWGEISGTSGRNTKVSGMRSSGKQKMAEGTFCIINDERYRNRYQQILKHIRVEDFVERPL